MRGAGLRRSFDWEDVYRRLREAEARLQQNWTVTETEKSRILHERAEVVAKKRAGDEAAGHDLELLEFTLAHERYGIESAHIREVCPLKELTPLPFTPAFLVGIVNVRGRIVPVLDLKKFFDLPDRGLSDMSKLLVLQGQTGRLGILADSVAGVVQVPAAALQPALPTLTGLRREYLLGLGPEGLTVLDAHKIVANPRLGPGTEPQA